MATATPAARTSVLDGIRRRVLMKRIIRTGKMRLDAPEYRRLQKLGLSRAEVNRAVDRLLTAGELETAITSWGEVWVRPVKIDKGDLA